MLKITDGKKKTITYKDELKSLGLSFKKTGKYSGYWYTDDDSRQRELLKFCNKRKLIIEKEDERYTRSSDYRTQFFKYNKGYKHDGKTYHCAYCGKKVKKDELEVDHVVAIDAVKNHILARLFIFLLGIHNINDTKNLVASCKKCNRKKSNKQGFWVLRGYLGKHIWFWRTLRFLIFIFISILVCYIYINSI